MKRWNLLALAVAVVACSKGDRDRAAKETSDAAAVSDSAGRGDRMTADTGAPREMKSRPAMAADTAARRAGPAADSTAAATRGPTGAEAMGGVRAPASGASRTGVRPITGRLDLSTDQVRRLQAALNDAGCDAGTVDGVVGRKTRQAIACGLEKNNLARNDLKGLYRALDLDF